MKANRVSSLSVVALLLLATPAMQGASQMGETPSVRGTAAAEDEPWRTALRSADAATTHMAGLLGLPTMAAPTGSHASPSEAVQALAARKGMALDAAQAAQVAGLDLLPDPARTTLLRMLDAFLALDEASAAVFDTAPGASWWTSVLVGDVAAKARLAALLAARSAFLDAVADASAGDGLAASAAGAARDATSVIDLCPLLAVDLRVHDNVHAADCHLIVDAGGRDTYANNAGGNRLQPPQRLLATSIFPQGNPVASSCPDPTRGVLLAAVVDLGDGDDHYGGQPRSCGYIGGGVGGMGMVLDEGGDDTYGGGLAVEASLDPDKTCLLLADGDVDCYGWSGEDYLGGDAVAIDAGKNSGSRMCAVLRDGNSACTGTDPNGPSNDPYLGGDAVDVAVGHDHTCYLRTSGSVHCIGRAAFGVAGDHHPEGDVVALDLDGWTLCMLLASGDVDCLGYDAFGQAADYHGGDAVQVRVNSQHTCILTTQHHVRCWGYDGHGKLVHDTRGDVVKMGLGRFHTCLLRTTGNVDCQGFAGSESYRAVLRGYHGGDAIDVDVGQFHACVLRIGGLVACWGGLAAASIDHGPRLGALGGGYLGIGLLVDGAGDDRYLAADGATNGAAYLGMGLLLDQAGDDVYAGSSGRIWNPLETVTREATNGAAYFAFAALRDEGGRDRYHSEEGHHRDASVHPKGFLGSQWDSDDPQGLDDPVGDALELADWLRTELDRTRLRLPSPVYIPLPIGGNLLVP